MRYKSFSGRPSGARSLMRGVLFVAERDLHSSHKRQRQDAKKWFLSDDEKHIFSFIPICDFLGLRPQAIRRQLGLV